MTLASAFSTAWKDLKAVASKVATVLTKDQAGIQVAVTDASAVVTALDPSAVGVVTAFDSLEEVIVGKIAAAAADVAKAASLESLFGEAWPAIKSLVATLQNHPTVASVTVALGGATASSAAAKS